MDKDNSLVQVTPDDIAFLEQELAKTRRAGDDPRTDREAGLPQDRRPAHPRRSRSTTPTPSTSVGDSIYKEYDEPLTVGSQDARALPGQPSF